MFQIWKIKFDKITNINHLVQYGVIMDQRQYYGPSQCYGPLVHNIGLVHNTAWSIIPRIDQKMINIR